MRSEPLGPSVLLFLAGQFLIAGEHLNRDEVVGNHWHRLEYELESGLPTIPPLHLNRPNRRFGRSCVGPLKQKSQRARLALVVGGNRHVHVLQRRIGVTQRDDLSARGKARHEARWKTTVVLRAEKEKTGSGNASCVLRCHLDVKRGGFVRKGLKGFKGKAKDHRNTISFGMNRAVNVSQRFLNINRLGFLPLGLWRLAL